MLPRLRSVMWRDFVSVDRLEVVRELLLPLAWLARCLLVAWRGHYAIAVGMSFTFFLTGARVVHKCVFTPRWV